MVLYCVHFTTVQQRRGEEIQRQMGVTYKTAWRMARLIREYMGLMDGATHRLAVPAAVLVSLAKLMRSPSAALETIAFDDKVSVLGMVGAAKIVSRVIKRRTIDEMFHISRNAFAPARGLL